MLCSYMNYICIITPKSGNLFRISIYSNRKGQYNRKDQYNCFINLFYSQFTSYTKKLALDILECGFGSLDTNFACGNFTPI